MDRWEDADDGIQNRKHELKGRVAALGIEGFVRGAVEAADPSASAGIQVVVSKKEQVQQRSAAAAAPAATPAALPFTAPAWVGKPLSSGAHLKVYKEQDLISQVPLPSACTLFGRNQGADVVLEHASVSRQHAIVAFKSDCGTCVVMDLGSAHGTFLDGKRLAKNTPCELPPGSQLKFGASTRAYVYTAGAGKGSKRQQDGDSAAGARAGKRSRVHFADGGSDEHVDREHLEQVIGYSDSRDFAARVGPRAAGADGERGQFADLVTSVVVLPAGRGGSTDGSSSAGNDGSSSSSSSSAKRKHLDAGEGLALKAHAASDEEDELDDQQDQQDQQQPEHRQSGSTAGGDAGQQQAEARAARAAQAGSSSDGSKQGAQSAASTAGPSSSTAQCTQSATGAGAAVRALASARAAPPFLPRMQQLPRQLLVSKKGAAPGSGALPSPTSKPGILPATNVGSPNKPDAANGGSSLAGSSDQAKDEGDKQRGDTSQSEPSTNEPMDLYSDLPQAMQ